MSEKNTIAAHHEWYVTQNGNVVRVQVDGWTGIVKRNGFRIPHALSSINEYISHGIWTKTHRPSDAISPAYGLTKKDDESTLNTADASTADTSTADINAADINANVGDVFCCGSQHRGDYRKFTILSVNRSGVYWNDGHEDGVTPLSIAMESINCGYWRRVERSERINDVSVEASDELTTLRRQHAEALQVIEALLEKYEPQMLVKIRGNVEGNT